MSPYSGNNNNLESTYSRKENNARQFQSKGPAIVYWILLLQYKQYPRTRNLH